MAESVATLSSLAKTHKARFTRAAKALLTSVKSLQDKNKSQYFFEETLRNQEALRKRHEDLVEIYCALEVKVPEEAFNNTYAQRVGEVENTFDDCEKKTADTIAKFDNARMETEDLLNQTLAAAGPAPAGGAAKYKLESSFEPKPKLSPEFNAGEFHVWQEQWSTYYDISGLQNANAKIQKAALINCLSTEFRTKLDFSHVPDVKEGLCSKEPCGHKAPYFVQSQTEERRELLGYESKNENSPKRSRYR